MTNKEFLELVNKARLHCITNLPCECCPLYKNMGNTSEYCNNIKVIYELLRKNTYGGKKEIL